MKNTKTRTLSLSSKAIKKALVDKDMTITELAEAVGYSRGHVSGIINGKTQTGKAVEVVRQVLEID